LIQTLFDRLSISTTGSYTLCANGHTPLIERYVSARGADDYRLNFFEDGVPRGPAGCLRGCEPHLRSDTVLVAGASVWFEDDPLWMVQEHKERGNALTVFCTRERRTGDGPLIPAGLYCAQRDVLEHIQTVGYQDIKEQLVPALVQAGRRVGAVPLVAPAYEVTDWKSYLQVIDRYLATDQLDPTRHRRLAPGVWGGQGVVLAPTARVVGPVFLGDGCRIHDGAVIIGPSVLGSGCRVGKGAWVTRTVAPDDTAFASRARITDQFLGAAPVRRHRQSGAGWSGSVIAANVAALAARLARKCGL
jgi:mannose-1-phosphate guanylyltransferase/phosphomannomutase